jgi:hypothetical protein
VATRQTIPFLCTGNYHRSRFAEVLFVFVARSVVFVVFGNLGAAASGVGAVAVEFDFGEEVGEGAVEDAERADGRVEVARQPIHVLIGKPIKKNSFVFSKGHALADFDLPCSRGHSLVPLRVFAM